MSPTRSTRVFIFLRSSASSKLTIFINSFRLTAGSIFIADEVMHAEPQRKCGTRVAPRVAAAYGRFHRFIGGGGLMGGSVPAFSLKRRLGRGRALMRQMEHKSSACSRNTFVSARKAYSQHTIERGLRESPLENLPSFHSAKAAKKCSPVPFQAKFLQVCPEIREYVDDSL